MAVIMTARRRLAGSIVALGVAPLALTGLSAAPAAAHGSLTDPVSRVSACFAEGPESPKSAACQAAVAAGGTQALYDWNGVNIANAAGKHRELIPDGKLCSAGNDKFKGLDLPRADWPSSPMKAGSHTFRFRATAPHKGSFELYLTKAGYDPSQPLKWSDLQEKPFAEATDPQLVDGSYVFDGTVPQASGRQLVYTVWQRSDSPEAFYACSDVVFGGEGSGSGSGSVAAVPAPSASAPSEQDIDEGSDKSSVEHNGHGDDDASTGAEVTEAAPAGGEAAGEDTANAPEPNSAAVAPAAAAADETLAETGGSGSTTYLAVGGAAALAVGASALFASVRRRAATGTHRG
ncbi:MULTISPECIES: lytic polysaccharide monooxygenase auxiliary activity family 9 protein [Streptomyces]|uniref:Chitin-binding protein n=1 Tax=Streptomyces clavifer TaxID=68188 RepID=A0ABS4VE82_9ACTN|nr:MULTISPECIES: lytic polysaccharide monooxygenase [Streptomyces]MBP2362234.1 chitin-binding protein [Streptomyces clavifer]MDX2747439.1 lytic polysaccharide monooxygenase [Streptomyces sp. NRRL_B-2557]MDX3062904.1 lytic polysaccharide monooxygenase [Streptomyces sp. ND04-05B]WRY81272.1 lytic polysaccharide monooxygenase [Streptomyces clavifer]GHB07388.1 chitin-binding protein [Streptomyces clavifer]